MSTAGLTLYAGVRRSTWIRLHLVEEPWTHVWMQVCADVNPESGDLAVTLNGGQAMKVNVYMLKTKSPKNLNNRVVLGLNEWQNDQFINQITNINIFSYKNNIEIENINPCLGGDYMNWSSTELEKIGTGMIITEDDHVCDSQEEYEILLPLVASWHAANHHCKRLGHMTQINNVMQLNITGSLAKDSRKSCYGIWTAISDELEEGEYRDTETGNTALFLPWERGSQMVGWIKIMLSLISILMHCTMM